MMRDYSAIKGCEAKAIILTRTWSWWGLGDIFGCAIIFSPACISTDKDDGGYYTFGDKVYVTLEEKSAAEASGR